MMQFKQEENSNSSGGSGEMAEDRVRELAPVGEDGKDKQEIDRRRVSHEGGDFREDISANLYRDDSEETEGKPRGVHGNPTVCKSSEIPSEVVSQESTWTKDEIRTHKDFTKGDCHSIGDSQDGEENKENCCIAVVPALAVTDSSASSEKEEYLKHLDPSSELVASLKNAANAAASQVAKSEEGESAHQAQEDGCVAVVFPGSVTQDTCCKFVCEILKCVLYLRQQLPMTYDQLVGFQKKQLAASRSEGVVGWRPAKPSGWDSRKCQRTLQDLEEVLQQLEVLFSLSRVPRVLLLLGGTTVMPKESYEVNMEALAAGAADRSLRASACLRRLFHDLFLADILSDARPVRLMATSVLALAHRDCGVGWFRPRLDYRVPARPKRRVIALSCDPSVPGPPRPHDGDDYVWFQAPVTIKGFCK
ncbi:MAD2L1-binding protein [Anguilla rostrata]|uniref:MAD2L1-binding protein n=1 Tax=Anguilla rostrata TaxID=7938 RepID=UPI0030D4C1EC